jgi:hypothetical protein
MIEELSAAQQVSDELDQVFLIAVRNELAKAKQGLEVNASLLNTARQRCRDLGLTKVIEPGDPIAAYARELNLGDPNVLKMPPISHEADLASSEAHLASA